jgi:AcrR family transcriptional regulator
MCSQTLKERQYQLREDTILETAHHLLIEHGYADLNMDDLANQIGISKATLYQHFPSKDELAVQVLLRAIHHSENHLKTGSSLPPLEQLEGILNRAIAHRAKIWMLRSSSLPSNIREDPRIKLRYAMMAAIIESIVEAGKADGSINSHLSTKVIVRMFSSFFTPHFQDLISERLVSPEELSETLVSIFLDGIRAKSS